MEIIVLSKEKSNKILLCIERMIAKHKWGNLALYADKAITLDELKKIDRKSNGYFILLDILSYRDWRKTIEEILLRLPQSIFCMIADKDKYAKEIVNSIHQVLGYINIMTDYVMEMIEKILWELYLHTKKIGNGILINQNNELEVIPYNDILCIETIKMRHLCNIYTKKEIFIIRTDINKLARVLDYRFLTVRASGIVNLEKIKAINTSRHQLILEQEVDCKYSERNLPLLMERLENKIHFA